MIVVHLPDEEVDFPAGNRFSTDEHNNLCVWGGRKTDALLAVFNTAAWVRVGVDDDGQG